MTKPFNSSKKQINFKNVTLNAKLLHIKPYLSHNIYPHCKSNFLNSRMDFFLRKVLKENNIEYTYYRTPFKLLVIDSPGSPFKFVFKFDDLGYVSIKRMQNGHNPIEYDLLAPTVQKLWDKMFHKGIIGLREYRSLIVPQRLNALQQKTRLY